MELARLTDNELMARVAEADPNGDALRVLYDRYAPTAFGLALRILGDRGQAEETLQEVFLRVWERADLFDAARGPFAAWLFTIARRLCIDRIRQQQARPQTMELPSEWGGDDGSIFDLLSDPQDDVAHITEARALNEKVRRALQTLPRDQSEILILSYFGGYTRREIAVRLKQPEGTVHTRARLGLKKMRAALLALGVDPDDWE